MTRAEREERLARWAGFPARIGDAARAAAGHPAVPGEWDPVEVVRHLIAVEREVWWVRFASIAEEDEPRWSWMEPGLEPGMDGASIDEALDRFESARARSVAIIDGFR